MWLLVAKNKPNALFETCSVSRLCWDARGVSQNLTQTPAGTGATPRTHSPDILPLPNPHEPLQVVSSLPHHAAAPVSPVALRWSPCWPFCGALRHSDRMFPPQTLVLEPARHDQAKRTRGRGVIRRTNQTPRLATEKDCSSLTSLQHTCKTKFWTG